MSDITTFIIVNAFLAGFVVLALLWLLSHHGIKRGRRHDLALIRRRALLLQRRASRGGRIAA